MALGMALTNNVRMRTAPASVAIEPAELCSTVAMPKAISPSRAR